MTLYIFDTDHLSLYERGNSTLRDQLQKLSANDDLAITVVSTQEQVIGRLSQIQKATSSQRLVEAYQLLRQTIAVFSDFQVLDYCLQADQRFRDFRSSGIRIGTLDLRIAAIALTHNAILLTRNSKDFGQVPHLTIDDWTA